MESRILAGVNLATLFGLGLILLTVALALVYNFLGRAHEGGEVMQALPVALLVFFVGIVLVLSFYFARKSRSAASFLGIVFKGVKVSFLVGLPSSLLLILMSPTMYEQYGLDPATAIVPLRNPGIVSIPLSFITVVAVSLATQKKPTAAPAA